ncbi:MAG TPA: hypothetical protein PLK40_08185 [Bacteroidaceae bacterium]|nr:hypothetical protein [Bacteroidaceae bacterium]
MKKIYILIYACMISMSFWGELQAQPSSFDINVLCKDSKIRMVYEWEKLRQETEIISPFSLQVNKDYEITELTKNLLLDGKQIFYLRPFELRIDFPEELMTLLGKNYVQYLCPSSLEALIKPQPFTYNMAMAACSGYIVGLDCWVVLDIPEFHVSDYELEIDNEWFWAEDWR